jgi:ATP-dependent protease Clp ATPase subunit
MYDLPGRVDVTEVVITGQVVDGGAAPTVVREDAAREDASA